MQNSEYGVDPKLVQLIDASVSDVMLVVVHVRRKLGHSARFGSKVGDDLVHEYDGVMFGLEQQRLRSLLKDRRSDIGLSGVLVHEVGHLMHLIVGVTYCGLRVRASRGCAMHGSPGGLRKVIFSGL